MPNLRFGGAEQALKYLARYTYRVAISNDRIESLEDGQVTFRYKAYAHGHRWRRMTLTAHEFLRRFMQHVLPRGFVRIRSFGFLANRVRDEQLALCRQLLGAAEPAAAPSSGEPASLAIPETTRSAVPTVARDVLELVSRTLRPRVSGTGGQHLPAAPLRQLVMTAVPGSPDVVLVTRLAATGRAQRTSVAKTAPHRSARPASSDRLWRRRSGISSDGRAAEPSPNTSGTPLVLSASPIQAP